MISFYKCFTGRRWVNFGSGFFAIGFKKGSIDRIYFRGKTIYAREKKPNRLDRANG